jgi:hypothetical protein
MSDPASQSAAIIWTAESGARAVSTEGAGDDCDAVIRPTIPVPGAEALGALEAGDGTSVTLEPLD